VADAEAVREVLGDEVVPGPHAAREHVPEEGLDEGRTAVAAAVVGGVSQGRVGRAKVRGRRSRRDSIDAEVNSIERAGRDQELSNDKASRRASARWE
jgi:hypothetical protein